MLWSDDHTGNIKEFANPRILQDGEFFAHIEFNQHGAGASKSKKMQHHKRPNSGLAFADAHVITVDVRNTGINISAFVPFIKPTAILAIKNAGPNAMHI